MPSSALTSGLAVVALAAIGLGTPAIVSTVGDSIARKLGNAAAPLVPAPAEAPERSDTFADVAPAPEPLADHVDAGAGKDNGSGHGRAPASERSGGSIEIGADRLARLTEKQLQNVHASDAVDASGRPLGARLHGVGGLGVGLADGDVVTSIDGRPTANADDATTAALGAYMSGEATVHGTLLRGGKTLRVTAHVPAR